MPLEIKHPKTLSQADDPDTTLARPSDWNAALNLLDTEDNLLWQIWKNNFKMLKPTEGSTGNVTLGFPTSYTDKAVQALQIEAGSNHLAARFSDTVNTKYTMLMNNALVTADVVLRKVVAGITTALATEAIDITASSFHTVKISCLGTSIKSFRGDMGTAKLTATDSAIASGFFGVNAVDVLSLGVLGILTLTKLVTATSPSLKPYKYFEMPVVGDGKENPYHVDLPKELFDDDINVNGINRLAVNSSCVIKTGSDGKPFNYIATVRVFDDSAIRQSGLRNLVTCVNAIKSGGAKELLKEDAVKLAKQIDDKLTDYDFIRILKPSAIEVDDLIKQRRNIYKIEEKEEDVLRFLADDKGW